MAVQEWRPNNIKIEFDPDVAVKIVDGVAEGKTLKEIIDNAPPGFPSRRTIYRWLAIYPAFRVAYDVAHTGSATSFEEMALEIAKRLEDVSNKFTASQVTAMNYAMQQYRWSAERRDPAKYVPKTNSITVVPIEINTTLNLGLEGQERVNEASIYEMAATIAQNIEDAEPVEAAVEQGSDLDVPEQPKRSIPASKKVTVDKPAPLPKVRGSTIRRKSTAGIKNTMAAHERRKANGNE